jgi:peptide/nickel transport system substrate-binding protein
VDLFQRKQSNWPSVAQWRQLHRVLTPKEKIALPILAGIFVFSFFSFVQGVYFYNATSIPAHGGSITEGIAGSPRFLNPLYADTNDADRDLLQLIYSGILRYNSQGELTADLASEMPQITEGGKVITVSLQENVQWHDGAPFSADDIIFTVNALKDPAAKSPIRANWIGVDIEKVSDYKVRFHLLEPYAPFLERLTLKILPAHLWSEISPENFPLTPLNLQPVGTGPYAIENISQNRTGFVREVLLQ